jgi:hypothetical protein
MDVMPAITQKYLASLLDLVLITYDNYNYYKMMKPDYIEEVQKVKLADELQLKKCVLLKRRKNWG